MAAARRAAARRASHAPEAADAEKPLTTPTEAEAPVEQADETVSGVAPGTLVVIESLIYAGRVYEPGQPLPPTFPADVAERRIADGSIARM